MASSLIFVNSSNLFNICSSVGDNTPSSANAFKASSLVASFIVVTPPLSSLIFSSSAFISFILSLSFLTNASSLPAIKFCICFFSSIRPAASICCSLVKFKLATS